MRSSGPVGRRTEMCSDAKKKEKSLLQGESPLGPDFKGLFWGRTCENYENGREEVLKGGKLKSLIMQLHYSERTQQLNINIINLPSF